MKKTKKQKKTNLLKIIGALLVLVAIVATLEATNVTHFFHNSAKVSAPSTPLVSLPAQPVSNKSPSTPSSTINQGGPTDKSGQSVNGVSNNPSDWATSASGVITLKSPTTNGTLKSGGTVTGSASVDTVQYRLTDNQVGVISQGPINVVGGNFTASISFTPYSATGRLDVFTTEPNGKEINEVQVPVNF